MSPKKMYGRCDEPGCGATVREGVCDNGHEQPDKPLDFGPPPVKGSEKKSRRMMRHNFQESYMRMKYASADGLIVEYLWNSRDAITPFIVGAKETDGQESERVDLNHVEWEHDEYRPDYVPEVGERVFVTLTEELARPSAIKYVDQLWDDEKYPMSQHPMFAQLGKAGAVDYVVEEWLKEWGGYPPTVVTVTPAMRAQFQARAEELAKGYRRL